MLKVILRSVSLATILTTIGIVFFSQEPSVSGVASTSALAPPKKVTPEIIAMRGCIEGVEHPTERELSNQEQITACNNHVRLDEDKIDATYFRALHLFENGTSQAHRAQAFQDFTFVIAAGNNTPSAFANRAVLNFRDRNSPELAVTDLDKAIELTKDRPRASYFERRALILLSLAERDADEAMVYAALDDAKTAKSLNPRSDLAPQLESRAADFLKNLHQNKGRSVQKG